MDQATFTWTPADVGRRRGRNGRRNCVSSGWARSRTPMRLSVRRTPLPRAEGSGPGAGGHYAGGRSERAGDGDWPCGQRQVVLDQCVHGLPVQGMRMGAVPTRRRSGARSPAKPSCDVGDRAGAAAGRKQVSGAYEVSGTVAYTPQQAWIMNATVQVGTVLLWPLAANGWGRSHFYATTDAHGLRRRGGRGRLFSRASALAWGRKTFSLGTRMTLTSTNKSCTRAASMRTWKPCRCVALAVRPRRRRQDPGRVGEP